MAVTLKICGKLRGGKTANERAHSAAKLPGYLANHAARVFNRTVEKALRPHGLTLTLVGPLLLLRRLGPMLQRDLVRESPVGQPAIVAALSKLESLAYIQRSPVSADGRAATITATKEGLEMAVIGARVLREMNANGLQGFSPEETAMLSSLLERLISNLEHL